MNNIRIHWSFWLICVVSLIWNMMGCINFMMQMNPEALANYPDAAKLLIESRPAWATAAFFIAVFGGAIGDIFLILRRSIAYYLFVLSLLGGVITNIHTFQVGASSDIWIGSAMSLAIAAFLIWYTRQVIAKGWIK